MHISHILEKKLLWYSRPSLALYPHISFHLSIPSNPWLYRVFGIEVPLANLVAKKDVTLSLPMWNYDPR